MSVLIFELEIKFYGYFCLAFISHFVIRYYLNLRILKPTYDVGWLESEEIRFLA